MRNHLLLAAPLLLFLCGSCTPKQEASKEASTYRITATIKDIMNSMVDPTAAVIWNSVKTTIDAQGVHEEAPRTDEEWKVVRANALILMEAPNLMMHPDRKVALPGEKSANPGIELEPEEMQKLIDADRAAFNQLANALQDATKLSLDAINAKDAEKLISVSAEIDTACENCHLKFWYPNEAKALEAKEKGAASPQTK